MYIIKSAFFYVLLCTILIFYFIILFLYNVISIQLIIVTAFHQEMFSQHVFIINKTLLIRKVVIMKGYFTRNTVLYKKINTIGLI